MRIKSMFYVLIASFLFLLSSCGNDSSVFGKVQVLDVKSGSGTVIGQRGYVTADKDSLTDEDLVNFFHSTISGSGHNWFTIAFGDGTGYVFPGSHEMFSHSKLDNEGASVDSAGKSGMILEESVDWFDD